MTIHAGVPEQQTLIKLTNVNGTCYINSILQCLYNIPRVKDYCWRCEEVFEGRPEAKTLAERYLFGFFVKIYVDSERAPQNEVYYEPTYFLDHVFEGGYFHRGEPSDAHEFFLFLANSLDMHSTQVASELRFPGFPSFCALFELFVDTRTNGWFGMTVSERRLVIPVTPGRNVRRALEAWMQPEIGSHSQIFRRFRRLGPCLAFHVNCYRLDEACGGLVKRWDTIELNDSLDVGDDFGPKHYELVGAVVHRGDSLEKGHYICVVRICETWVVADDTNLWGLGDAEATDFLTNGFGGTTVSMVFYHQTPLP
jgi:ubiquitin C-terminal hydrolase